ncbi:MAG: hydantoinase B/oxoprolinase family protein, partial [Gemmatimonadota bacterium]
MQTARPRLSAVELEVYRAWFTAAADEMGATLRRTAHSPNIKERRDYSCAVFNARGEPVALADHMPVHLGAMPRSVEAVLRTGRLRPGDVAVLNDPFGGGTHLPDVTAVRAVAAGRGGRVLAYVASRAHHADVGGMTPGSMPLAEEIYQEGLRLPVVRLVRAGRLDDDLWRTILANVRTPEERAGDLRAQLASLDTG